MRFGRADFEKMLKLAEQFTWQASNQASRDAKDKILQIIFLGTPEFAVPTLKALIEAPEHQVVAVLCQPDRPAGRGNKLHAPPVKELAVAHNIPVFQPERLSRSPEIVEAMRALNADVIVMVAFGQILKKEVLSLTKYGVINIHGSLLPRYRGAAPINWCIINGEKITGITTMITEAGVDTGPMLLKAEVPIGPDMTSDELALKMSAIGANLLLETLSQLSAGELKPEAQDDSLATLAPIMTKETGRIKWTESAQSIHNLVRGVQPWPAAVTTYEGAPLKIWQTKISTEKISSKKAGCLYSAGDHVYAVCGENGDELLELCTVQPANKTRMSGRNWANGIRLKGDETLG